MSSNCGTHVRRVSWIKHPTVLRGRGNFCWCNAYCCAPLHTDIFESWTAREAVSEVAESAGTEQTSDFSSSMKENKKRRENEATDQTPTVRLGELISTSTNFDFGQFNWTSGKFDFGQLAEIEFARSPIKLAEVEHPRRVGPQRVGGGAEGWGPRRVGGPKFRAFFHSPAAKFVLFFLNSKTSVAEL